MPHLPKALNVGCKILRTLISILTILFFTSSCKTGVDKTVNSNSKFDTLPRPNDSATFYFKTKQNWQDTTINAVDSFVNSWYSKMLFALQEPVLKNYNGDKEIYRFTWLRTFNHPISVRLEKQGDVVKLFSKVICGKPKTRTPLLTSNITELITYPQWVPPQSIVTKEILPAVKKNPGYLSRKGFSLLDFKCEYIFFNFFFYL